LQVANLMLISHLQDIEVKPGWRKGTKIRFAGLGNERAPPMPPQDVIFIVDEVPHPKFRREGANLFTTCDISLLDALCQTRHVIQGLDGQDVIVDVGHDLAGGIIRPGDISRVAGMGMPVRKNSQVVSAGDLIIK
jgi:DnaJ family protein B protein 4